MTLKDLVEQRLFVFHMPAEDGNLEILIIFKGLLYLMYSKNQVFEFLKRHEGDIKKVADSDTAPSEISLRVMQLGGLPTDSNKPPLYGFNSTLLKLAVLHLATTASPAAGIEIVFEDNPSSQPDAG